MVPQRFSRNKPFVGLQYHWISKGPEYLYSAIDQAGIFFFYTLRHYIYKLQIDKLLYNATRTIPGGAKYHDYPLAFKVPLWSRTKWNEVHSLCSLWLICHLDFRPEEYLDKNLNTTTKETEYRERRLEDFDTRSFKTFRNVDIFQCCSENFCIWIKR